MKTRITYIDSEDLYKVMESLYLKLDALMETLAPEGWNKSPYHFAFVPIAEESAVLYKHYEVVAQAYKQQFGISIPKYLAQGQNSVDKLYQVEGYQERNNTELIYLIEFALVQLGENGLFFKQSAPHLYYSIDEYFIEEQSFDIWIEHPHLNTQDYSSISINKARHDLLHHIDLSALYAEILYAFSQLDYDWRYQNQTLENLWLNYKESAQQQQHIDHLSKEIANLGRKLPPDQVIGYISTYEKLPKGYPPKVEDLQALDNSISR